MLRPEDDVPVLTVCQGPPRCLLEGDDAARAAEAGCVWCKRIRFLPNGDEHVIEPGNA